MSKVQSMLGRRKDSFPRLRFFTKEKKAHLTISRAGVSYKSPGYSFIVPWVAIQVARPASALSGKLCLHLTSSDPKRVLIAEKMQYIVDDDLGEAPLKIDGRCAYIEFSIDLPPVVQAITIARYHVASYVDGQLIQGRPAKILSQDSTQRLLRLEKGGSYNFPNFCPINGHPCDSVYNLHSENTEAAVPFLVSLKGQRRELRQNLYRGFGTLILFLFFLYLSFNQAWEGMQASLLIFLLLPPLWYFTRKSLRLWEDDEGRVLYIHDPEYYLAFVELNR